MTKPDQFISKIKNEFPKLSWVKFEYITHGFDHDVVILDDKIVFRFPKTNEFKKLLANEVKLLRYLNKKQNIVGIPDYTFIASDKSFAGYKLLSGQELKPDVFRKLPTPVKESIAIQLADFLTRLHSTNVSAVNRYEVVHDNHLKNYKKLVRKTTKNLYPKLSAHEVGLLKKYFNELKETLTGTDEYVLIHKDLAGSNMLWNQKTKKLSIIDFSDRAYSDPAYDFSNLWNFDSKFVKRVYELYDGKKDGRLLSRSKLYAKRIPLNIMVAAVTGKICNYEDGYKMFKKLFR